MALPVTEQTDICAELSQLREQVEMMQSTIAQQAAAPAQGARGEDNPPPYLPV
jgi:hypothetical protein